MILEMIFPKMETVFANPEKAGKLRDLSDQLEGKADSLLSNLDQLDVIEDLASDFGNDLSKMETVFENPEKAGKLRDLSDQLEGKADNLLSNLDQLDVIEDLASDFGNDLSKMETVFANPEKAGKLRDLSDQLEGNADNLLSNLDQLDVIEDLASDFENDLSKMETVFANPEKAGKLRDLSDQLEGNADNLLSNLDQLDVIGDLASDFGNDLSKMETVFANPEKAGKLRDLSDQLEGKADSLLSNLDQLDVIEDLASDFGNDLSKMETVFANPEKAGKLRGP